MRPNPTPMKTEGITRSAICRKGTRGSAEGQHGDRSADQSPDEHQSPGRQIDRGEQSLGERHAADEDFITELDKVGDTAPQHSPNDEPERQVHDQLRVHSCLGGAAA